MRERLRLPYVDPHFAEEYLLERENAKQMLRLHGEIYQAFTKHLYTGFRLVQDEATTRVFDRIYRGEPHYVVSLGLDLAGKFSVLLGCNDLREANVFALKQYGSTVTRVMRESLWRPAELTRGLLDTFNTNRAGEEEQSNN